MIFDELMHIKALSHLSNSIKKELASVVAFESHPKSGTLSERDKISLCLLMRLQIAVFSQGDIGTSWYIILRGSVNVVIVGKGVVCTLQLGDDFGKLGELLPRMALVMSRLVCDANVYSPLRSYQRQLSLTMRLERRLL